MAKSNSVGTKFKVGTASNEKVVGGLTSINGIEINADTLDVTDLGNVSGYREKLPGFKDAGDVTLAGYLDSEDSGQDELYALLESGEPEDFKIVFPAKIGKTWSFKGGVIGFKTDVELEDAIKFEVTIAVSGKPTLGASAG